MTVGRSVEAGGLVAPPGTRTTGEIDLDLGPFRVSLPLILLAGSRGGLRIGVTAGIHGAEYVSIAALRRVAMELDPKTLTGSLVAVPIANPAAFFARSIYVNPLDGKNLNRVFPGDPSGSPSERLADWLFQHVIAPSDCYVDMHCGDMNEALISFAGIEETGRSDVDAIAMRMAEAYGLDYVVVGSLPGSTTTAAASAGIPAVLGEVGGQGLWPGADVARHADGLLRVLASTGLLEDGSAWRPSSSRILRQDVWLRAPVSGCWHPAVAVGSEVNRGQRVGEIQDAFGETQMVIEAPQDGVVLFLVTSLAMNAGDPLLAIGA